MEDADQKARAAEEALGDKKKDEPAPPEAQG